MPQPKTRIYEIHGNMRVSNSPFHLENTNIRFDVSKEIILPNSTTILENGEPLELRFIARATSINKRQQIKEGWPEVYKKTAQDEKFLTFTDGRLEIPETQKNAILFLEKAGWFDEHKSPRMPGVKIVYKRVDTGKEVEKKLTFEDRVIDAKIKIRELKASQAKDLLRLTKPNRQLSPQITSSDVRSQLYDFASTDPDFILNGIKGNEDRLAVLLSKAVNYNIINLDTVGKVSLVDGGNFKPLFNVSESGGRERKFEKTLEWLAGDDGSNYQKTIEERVQKAEENIEDENGEENKTQKGDTTPPPPPPSPADELNKLTKPMLQQKYRELIGNAPEDTLTKADLIEAILSENNGA